MMEVLCARTPAVLRCDELKSALAFYTGTWGFEVVQQVTGVFATLRRESVRVQLWQRRADEEPLTLACRLLVDSLASWQFMLQSAPGQTPQAFTAQRWGSEFGLSDVEGNRLLLVQSAAKVTSPLHAFLPASRQARP